MGDCYSEGGKRIMDTVHRLRQVQEDFAGEPDNVRHQHLREEIERALAQLVPDERERFLDELLRYVPWPGGPGANGATAVKTQASTSLGSVEDDPEQLAARLVECWSDMDESARATVRQRLSSISDERAEGAQSTTDGLTSEQLELLRRQLRLRSDAPIHTDRLFALVLELMPFINRASQVSLHIWRDLSADLGTSAAQTPPDPQKMFQKYLLGDESVTHEQVKDMLDQNQKLIASLLQALQVLSRITTQIKERFSVEKIERMAKLGQRKKGALNILTGKPFGEICWETFKLIAEKSDVTTLEREMKRQVAEYVEDNLRPY